MARLSFELHATAAGSRARAGTVTTPHGAIATPVFMPVGTRGSVRTQTLDQLAELGPAIILANTYHLLVRPGPETMRAVGGLHRWMGWDGALLTDSGGFQIFSLPGARTMGEDGAEFRSYVDGRRLLLSPERSIEMQQAIGSDIMMVLDQCIPSTAPRAEAEAAMALTHRWAARSLAARGDGPGALFAIVQGACFPDLRRASADALTQLDGFEGYAIGGLAVGEGRAQREDLTELAAGLLPAARPRYLMGVGTPLDLLEGVHRGVDMFDCVMPTAWAQQGVAFTSRGKIDLRRGVHVRSEAPLDPACPCPACARYARSYLHHLVKCKEPLGWQLLAFHNLRFYLTLMRALRAEILDGTFAARYPGRRAELERVDVDNPPGRHPRPASGPPRTRGAFEVQVSPRGFASIRHVASGEVMHSVNPPDEEAERLYVAQCRRLPRTLAAVDAPPLVVWDVGLGAAHNAMAWVRALAARPDHGPVELVSFEHDLDALHLALANQRHFPHLRHEAPHRLLAEGVFARGALRWRLVRGDFLATLAEAPAPDVVLYDPFSTAVDGPLWHPDALARVHAACRRPAELFTYSASTAVRSALLAAGFWVAHGVATGPKATTTIALCIDDAAAADGRELLDQRWLARRARSSAPAPAALDAAAAAALDARVRAHPQFAATAGA
ncbi:MAG: tRNA guanosine(34) transglycosylase Tgt [Kofleriaceae bacterium]